MEHILKDLFCIICEHQWRITEPGPCPGPQGFGARVPDPEFTAKIRTISIHSRGR